MFRRFSRYFAVLLFLLPIVLLYFGINSAVYRYSQRAEAVPMTAIVEDYRIEAYSCEDSDGNTRTCERIAYSVVIEVDGQPLQRPLLDSDFDHDDIWHTPDMISPEDYPRGAEMPVLVRPDLGHLVVIEAFWPTYILAVVLIVFGSFWLAAFIFLVPAIIRGR